MSLTSNLLDKYGTVKLNDKWILFPDGHIADCHGNEFNYADWSKGQPYKHFYSKETGYVAVYKLVCDKFNLTRCERNAIHHNTFNKSNDGVEELTILSPSEHSREHHGLHKSTKSYQAI